MTDVSQGGSAQSPQNNEGQPPAKRSGGVSFKTFLVVAGLLLLAGGLFVGFSSNTGKGASCGSAFVPDRFSAQRADFTDDVTNTMVGQGYDPHPPTPAQDACKEAIGSKGTIAWVLIIVGVVGAAAATRAFTDADRPEQIRQAFRPPTK